MSVQRRRKQEEPETTTVNGIGLWTQWTRNFKTPLLAMLDLMDNAFDAAICDDEDFRGLVHVHADTEPNTKTVSGVAILNNSFKHIKPMAQVLEVYQSSKGDQSESIGENGVGLKQGCATLSDLSFALSKNLGQYSLGVVAKSLQQMDGCVLLSFSFTNFPQKDELQELFTEHEVIGQCIEEYGNGSLDDGIDRFLGHYECMLKMEDRHHVFCVVLHELKHNPTSGSVVLDVDSSDDDAYQIDYAQNAKGLMTKLKQELPRQYIHISSRLDVKVDGKEVVFAYWQKRLVELSSFEVKIDPKKPITKSTKDWNDPVNGYTLKVYAGFDPIRVAATSKSALSLFIYSRQSGRLILQEADGRNTLGLPTGGTEHCQGLTLVVDDYHGKLPLNPTKQDLAFGEETHGETHRANLMNWLGGVTKVFWKNHLSKFEGESKALLTEEMKGHFPTVQAFQRSLVVPRPLHECNLSTFVGIRWCLRGQDKVTVSDRSYQNVTGVDTLISIQETQARKEEKEEKKQTLRKRKSTTTTPSASASSSKKTKQTVVNSKNEEEVEGSARLQFDENENEHPSAATQMSQDSYSLEDANSRLLKKVAKYRTKLTRYKVELGKKVAEVEELQEENASLKEEHRMVQQENASLKEDHQAASIDNNSTKIDELQTSLHAANRRAEVAEVETQIQQETANEYRKKYAELRAASMHASI